MYVGKNSRANILSKLTRTENLGYNQKVILETLFASGIESYEIISIKVAQPSSQMDPILHYLTTHELSSDEVQTKKVLKLVAKYILVYRKLYKIGRSSPIIRCLGEDDTTLFLAEIHQGTCNIHIGGRSLTHKLLREGYYWPTLMKDIEKFVRK